MADLYRKSSIEKLSNPEQLDRAIKITSPMSWLALLGVVLIIVATVVWAFTGTLPTTQSVAGVLVHPESVGAYHTEHSGTVTKLLKKAGDTVVAGDALAVIKSNDGTEHTVKAAADGKLTELLAEVDTAVYAGAELARFTPNVTEDQVVVCYVPLSVAVQFERDMDVLLYPSSVDSQKHGHMEGKVVYVGEYAAATTNMWYVLGADNLVADQFLAQGPVVAVVCRIKTDAATKSGYYWTSAKGKNVTLSNGSIVTAKVVTESCAPITKLFSQLNENAEG